MDLKDVSYVEIDDADEERTHLLVTVNDADGAVIEIIIEQYPLEERVRAHAMARRLSGLLGLPLKLLKDRDCEGADHHRCRFSKCRWDQSVAMAPC